MLLTPEQVARIAKKRPGQVSAENIADLIEMLEASQRVIVQLRAEIARLKGEA